MFFLLFAACALFLQWQYVDVLPQLQWLVPCSLLVLFVSVLLHESGHVWFARRHEGVAEQIILGPLGGLVPVHVIGDPRAEFTAHLAGPAVNLILCTICTPALVLTGSQVWGLLNPLSPDDLTIGTTTEVMLKLTFWLNWTLLLINLIPAFPLDGGYALRSALLARWPMLGPVRASRIATRTGQAIACLLAIGALLWRFDEPEQFLAIRLSLVLLAILLFFSARQRRLADEREEEDSLLLGYEFTGSLAALERDVEQSGAEAPGPLRRWMQQRRQTRLRRQREQEQQEEKRVDEILARLHEQGMQSLSTEDRALLERVSARYRSRLRQ